jgi:hypothetical protein
MNLGSFTRAVLACFLFLVPGMAAAQTTGAAGFEKLATLQGEWKSDTPDGKTTVVYRLVADGSVLMEDMSGPGGISMVTMYHLDGSNLILTHYCAAKNQPRLRVDLAGSRPDELKFRFLDATNLSNPNAGHMHDLTLTIRDKDHLTQRWIFRSGGKDSEAEVFNYVRVR